MTPDNTGSDLSEPLQEKMILFQSSFFEVSGEVLVSVCHYQREGRGPDESWLPRGVYAAHLLCGAPRKDT